MQTQLLPCKALYKACAESSALGGTKQLYLLEVAPRGVGGDKTIYPALEERPIVTAELLQRSMRNTLSTYTDFLIDNKHTLVCFPQSSDWCSKLLSQYPKGCHHCDYTFIWTRFHIRQVILHTLITDFSILARHKITHEYIHIYNAFPWSC